MNDTPPTPLNIAQRMGGSIHGVVHATAVYLGKAIRDLLVGLWICVGSDQVRNAILLAGMLVFLFLASRFLLVEKELRVVSDNVKNIADAQRIQGFAYMHQLQSTGVIPPDAPGKPAPEPKAISPEALIPPVAPVPGTKAP